MAFNIEHLGINHSESIGQMLKVIPTALSEYCFPNLFLFRDKHKYNIINNMGDQYISGLSYDGQRYIMPLVDLENCSDEYLENLKSLLEEYDCIFPIPEKWLHLFPENNFRKEFIIDDSEYIYNREKLSEYPGRKLSKKRNLVKQFLRDNNPEIKAINDISKPAIIKLLELWQARTYQEMGSSDYHSCIEALENFESLNLSGALFLTDGEPCGFIIGEATGESSYVIHFAKGDTSRKGIYQYMFQAYVKEFCKDYKFINLEQDMGIEGLRKTKHSYQPDFMLHKYRIYKN